MEHTRTAVGSARRGSARAMVGVMALAAAGLGGLIGSALPAHANGCDRVWAAAVDGAWTDASKWSPSGVPSGSEVVCITAAGTYTVTLQGGQSVASLVVGAASASPTLRLSGSAALTASAGITVETGATVDQAYDGTGISVNAGGDGVTNRGTWSIAAAGGLSSQQQLWQHTGDFHNNGTLSVAPYAVLGVWPDGVEWVNNGTVSVGAEGWISIHADTGVFRHTSGTINGPGYLWLDSGAFVQGAGTQGPTAQVVVWNGDLTYEGDGAGLITAYAGSGTLTGAPGAGQVLRMVGTCDWGAGQYRATGDLELEGVIRLGSRGCNDATLDLDGHVLHNHGTLRVDSGGSNQSTVHGDIESAGTIRLAPRTVLAHDSGSLMLEAGSRVALPYQAGAPLGRLAVVGNATLTGTLRVLVPSGTTPPPAEAHRVLDASSVAGAFSLVNSQVSSGSVRYFQPLPDATGMTLKVRSAAISVVPSTAKRSASLSITGTNLPPGATASLVFVDHAGRRRSLASTLVAGNGSIAKSVAVPAAAALGAGRVEVSTTLVPLVLRSPVLVVA